MVVGRECKIRQTEQNGGGHTRSQNSFFVSGQGLVYVVAIVQPPQPLATTLRGLWVSQKRVLGVGCALEALDVYSDRAEHVDGTVSASNRQCQ